MGWRRTWRVVSLVLALRQAAQALLPLPSSALSSHQRRPLLANDQRRQRTVPLLSFPNLRNAGIQQKKTRALTSNNIRRSTPTDLETKDSATTLGPLDSRVAQAAVAVALLGTAALFANQFSNDVSFASSAFHTIRDLDVGAFLTDVSRQVEDMGPAGVVYFAAIYVAAEVLALPAVPLTASAGYLFGAVEGTAVVLVAATIAAGVSFLIGRFLLRGWVESIASESPQFRAIDAAVKREGFKIVLLLRLSPIFPFALSNYIYGLTAVDFVPYLAATLIGFAPGTALYVYGGEVASIVQATSGQAATSVGAPFPWYAYAGFLAAGIALAAKVTDIASEALKESGAGLLDDEPGI